MMPKTEDLSTEETASKIYSQVEKEFPILEGSGINPWTCLRMDCLVGLLDGLEEIEKSGVEKHGIGKRGIEKAGKPRPKQGSPVLEILKAARERARYLRYRPKLSHNPEILFFVFTANHVKVVVPLAKELEKRRINYRIVRFDQERENYCQKILEESGLEYESFEGYMSSWVRHTSKAASRDLLGRAAKLWDRKIYRDFTLQDFFDRNQLRSRLSETCLFVHTFRSMIEKEKPKVFVVMNEVSPIGRTAVLAAKSSHVHTATLQHGIIADFIGYGQILSDLLCAEGQYAKDYFVSKGTSAQKIVLTGQPKYDAHFGKAFGQEALGKLGLDTSKKIILLTSQPPGPEMDAGEYKRFLRSVVETASKFPTHQLVAKLHPRETEQEFKDAICGLEVPVITKDYLAELLSACDVMVTQFSTTALEAMILEKPVITVNYTGEADMVDFAKMGASIGVYKEAGLYPAIERILTGAKVRDSLKKGQKKFLKEHLYRIDGKSTMRTVNCLEQLISGEEVKAE